MQLVIGRIGRAHGVRGDVFVEPFTDEPDFRFATGSQLQTDSGTTLIVESTKWHSGKFVVHFQGIDDRTSVELLGRQDLVIEVDPLELPAGDDEFYDHQLVGLVAKLIDESLVGTVREVIHLPAQDLLAVQSPDGHEILIPFVKQIVPEVNVAAGFLTLTPPAGLLNEAEAVEVRGELDED